MGSRDGARRHCGGLAPGRLAESARPQLRMAIQETAGLPLFRKYCNAIEAVPVPIETGSVEINMAQKSQTRPAVWRQQCLSEGLLVVLAGIS
mmetsp:Transcript_4287/g.12364  ORF Transcript_4287/g.12364 Transcript_4287/m.12364 type:complete len:92 (+) Transcript_4287:229-504(+)